MNWKDIDWDGLCFSAFILWVIGAIVTGIAHIASGYEDVVGTTGYVFVGFVALMIVTGVVWLFTGRYNGPKNL